ncbi:acyl--CoA ligase [Streptomyces sioyaensis]|uniref:class I adenylate-forming enzyme family protein n=1 Tax=Streptomyces sioyaensis TaxID=67364 RepID=UPI001F262C3F|nr:class I adenylate-forming enzyme family protein [Streptomyces sioyaensis]MCF3172081.1 acyl--CoA ligase [Streptomyces sioyaensis]
MITGQAAGRSGATAGSRTPHTDWVDDVLLHGPAHDICLVLDAETDRQTLRAAVRDRQKSLEREGLRPGGTLALQLPPSLEYVALLLAGWRLGAQVILLDHRLTEAETERAVTHTDPQLLVSTREAASAMRGFHRVTPEFTRRPEGGPARSDHALVQLSSGSTGPSKMIGRTAEDLVTELQRYSRLDGMPNSGEQLMVLGSLSHTWGLVGGLLHGLHAGARIVLPARTSVRGILATVADAPVPTTLLGVPAQVALLSSVERPPQLPRLVRMMTAGGRTPAKVARAFTERYAVPLSQCYGMTETGMITMDLSGKHHPSVGTAVPGVRVRAENGELLVELPRSPYLGDTSPGRWSDGWLHTLDAGEIDPGTGLVTVLGRLDSQVSIRGLKVDLTEVEETLAGLDGVTEAVVLHQDAIDAYLTLAPEASLPRVQQELAARLASFKLPSRWYVLPRFPRTATGKPRRDPAVLRAAAA